MQIVENLHQYVPTLSIRETIVDSHSGRTDDVFLDEFDPIALGIFVPNLHVTLQYDNHNSVHACIYTGRTCKCNHVWLFTK